MKIRIAFNSYFVSRKKRGAVCGTFLLLTFFVLIASLKPTPLSAAQSANETGKRFTGEHISIDYVNMPLVDFFRTISEVGGINIMIDPNIQGVVTLKVEKIPWDELFDSVLANHGMDRKVQGSLIRVALKTTLQAEAKQEEELRNAIMLAGELQPRIKRLNYAKAKELESIVSEMKSPRGIVIADERSNSLILTDLPDYYDKMIRLVEGLDIPQPQVEIEARIVAATRNFARDIGVQFGFVQGNNQRVTVGGSNTSYLQPGPANRPMADTSSSSEGPGVSTSTSGDTGGNLNVNLPARTPFGGIGLAVGNVIDIFQLDAAITAGESKGSAKLVSQPKVAAQNNSPAVITNGVRIPVQINSDNTITIQFVDAALMLTATPQITYNGNILLDLEVSNNKADFGYTSTTGVPTIRTNETSTRIMVNDGGTTMLGGILIEDEGKNEDRIPGLASLPLLGNIFRRTGTTRDTQEIIFFVTPRILK